jgi:hypothetical protein
MNDSEKIDFLEKKIDHLQKWLTDVFSELKVEEAKIADQETRLSKAEVDITKKADKV